MKPFQNLIAVVLVLGMTILSGVVFGKMSNRWGPSRESLAAAEKLETFPDDFDEESNAWKLLSSVRMDDAVVNMLECSGHVSRVYHNEKSGEIVSVAVILGPPGPIAVHTPEVCIGSGKAQKALGDPKRMTVGNSDDELWTQTFQKNDISESLTRVWYGWTQGDQWAAEEDPRWTFASSPYLYKIQIASDLSANADLDRNDPCENFLADMLPELKDYLIDCSADR